MLEFFFGKTKPASSSLDGQVIDLNKCEGSSKQRPLVHLPPLSEELVQALQRHLNIYSLNDELVKKMPKTDLHVHAEAGFLMDMQLARKLAERNKVEFPEYLIDPESDLWMYRGLEDFCQFLKDFRAISKLIQTPQDVEDITYAFYKYCYKNNVIFALPGISWIQCKDKMGFPEFIQAYNNALLNGMREFGEVSILRLRYYMERQVTEEENEEIWQNLRALPNRLITTIGLAGDELNHPFGKFIPFYEKVREHRAIAGNQPYFLTAHMEKYSDSQTILEATRLLDWIAHGRNAVDSEDCLNAMIAKGMRFEICPKSDIAVYEEIPDLDQHIQLKNY